LTQADKENGKTRVNQPFVSALVKEEAMLYYKKGSLEGSGTRTMS
jgi:hypothetical protein